MEALPLAILYVQEPTVTSELFPLAASNVGLSAFSLRDVSVVSGAGVGISAGIFSSMSVFASVGDGVSSVLGLSSVSFAESAAAFADGRINSASSGCSGSAVSDWTVSGAVMGTVSSAYTAGASSEIDISAATVAAICLFMIFPPCHFGLCQK